MTKLFLSMCLTCLFWASTAAHAAPGVNPRSNSAAALQRTESYASGAPQARKPGPSWYLSMGCISLFALARLRRLGLDKLRRQGLFQQGPVGDPHP